MDQVYEVTVSTSGTFTVTFLKNGKWRASMYLYNNPALYGHNVFRILNEIDESGYLPSTPTDSDLINQAYALFGGV